MGEKEEDGCADCWPFAVGPSSSCTYDYLIVTAHVHVRLVPGLPSEWLQADIALSANSSGSTRILIGSLMTKVSRSDG